MSAPRLGPVAVRCLLAGLDDPKRIRQWGPRTRTALERAGLVERFALPGPVTGGTPYGWRLTAAGTVEATRRQGMRR